MVAMVFPSDVRGHPGQNYIRPRKPNDADDLFQGCAMSNGLQRMQHVLCGRILTAQKPYIRDAENRERVPCFHLSHIRQRLALLHPNRVGPRNFPEW